VLWQVAFALTLACELPVYVLALRRPLDGTWRALAVGVAVNVATHPLAWALAVRGALPYLAIEGGVWLVEAALIYAAARAWRRRLPIHESLLVSLAANGFSAGVGLLIL